MKGNVVQKTRSVAVKLTVRICLVLLAVFVAMIANTTIRTGNDLVARELEKLQLLANQNASVAKDFMNVVFNKQQVLLSAVASMDKIAPEEKAIYLTDMINSVKKGQTNILSLFLVAEPNQIVPDSPNGFSVIATAAGVQTQKDRFSYVDEAGYTKGFQAGSMMVLDPFKKDIDGKEYTVISVMQPIFDSNKKVIGMLGSNIDIKDLEAAQYNRGGYETFNMQIICGHKTTILNSRDNSLVGTAFAQTTTSTEPDKILAAATNATALTFLDKSQNGEQFYRAFVPFYVGSSTTPWLSGTGISRKEFINQMIAQMIELVLISMCGLLALVAFCYFSIHRALNPLKTIDKAVHRLSEGDLSVSLGYDSDDEIGALCRNFNVSIHEISGYIHDIDKAMAQMSTGDFNVKPAKPFAGDFSGIEKSITNFIFRMSSTLEEINMASDSVSDSSTQMASSATTLSNGASEQSQAIESLSNTIMGLSDHVDQNAQSSKTAAIRVREAATELKVSTEKMNEMIAAMDEISNNSAQIGKIIKVIEDIAFQTNILALNAAVEAARAGSAGKGFAVVADEVRNLAGKSAEAARNTTTMIGQSIHSVEAGVRIAADAARAIETVAIKAAAVGEMVEQIQDASFQQAQAIASVSQGTREISAVVQSNSAAAEESAAASEELSSQAQMLKSQVRRFRINQDLLRAMQGK